MAQYVARKRKHGAPRDPNGRPYPELVKETLCPDGCGAVFEPICPTYRCDGRRQPLVMLRSERELEFTRKFEAVRSPQALWDAWCVRHGHHAGDLAAELAVGLAQRGSG